MPVEIKELKVTIEVRPKSLDIREIEKLVLDLFEKERSKVENNITLKALKKEGIKNAR
ncbi:MAG TPA: hypothetical protein PLC76_00955 [Saprospiraceae bacterium]|nr:MAG: hypothetical protein UZ08_BCD001001560 [Candidatus Parvibacillus calidus]MCC7149604.1 hypothetical protein [Saprospiraceae bacterium]HPB52793.1 hypothetical protein [Saprospiraceae bacterium]HRN32888.1 hypothetical protein [Saprospiraceae bacterium]HRP83261.1 hypothetical protein [Saprospiraceae bacterium]